MLSSITPLGERGRATRWSVTVTAHLLGSASGGALLGTSLGTVGFLLPGRCPQRSPATVATFPELAPPGRRGLEAPVPRLGLRPRVRGAVGRRGRHDRHLPGAVPGDGFHAGHRPPTLAALVGLVFGMFRALPLLGVRTVRTLQLLGQRHRRLERGAPRLRRLTVARSVLVALVPFTLLLGGVL